MLTGARALSLSVKSAPELPRVAALESLYQKGVKFRQGQVIMVAGRSGSMKSMFTTWLVEQMGLQGIYFMADMSPFDTATRLAAMHTRDTIPMVESGMGQGGEHAARYLDALAKSNLQFSFGAPISWRQVEEELEAYIHLWDDYPRVAIFDNLMDFDNAESDYTEQMAVMAGVTDFARETGATTFILHHASDKSWEAKSAPWNPPSRDQVKGGLSEKPELSLSVALDPTSLGFNIAVIKNRTGQSDPTAQNYATIRAVPESASFEAWQNPYSISA